MNGEDTREEAMKEPALPAPGAAGAAYYRPGVVGWIQEELDRSPWWIISAAVHAVVLLVMMLIVVKPIPTPEIVEFIFRPEILRPPIQEKTTTLPAIFTNRPDPSAQVEPEIFEPVFIEANDPNNETADNDPHEQAKHDINDSIDDSLNHDVGVFRMGVGNSGMGGKGIWAGRLDGGMKNQRRRVFGSPSAEYLNRALEWLARHQEPDGHWDARKYGAQNSTDVGVTGLALMAFLGDGHTELVRSKYHKNVTSAIAWLISKQDADGCIGRGYERGLGYHHAIAGLALAEATGMNFNKVGRTMAAAQKAVDYTLESHQKDYSGWRYEPKQDADLSVTGWFVMQLKSAKVAGLKVDGRGFQGAIAFLDSVTEQPAGGNYGGRASYQPGRTPTPTMTAVGVLCRQFMGWKYEEPVVRGGLDYVTQNPPEWRTNSDVNFYYWYYGTLAAFQGPREIWDRWNEAMKKTLIDHQVAGGDDDGSWEPVGTWCPAGGRVFSTALGALCLEVYWRYNFGGWR